MNEGEDKLLRRYRELARDEPPPAVDAALLAASRRAVASRPGSLRLAGPLSIAAVLVLAVGVTLNMQREQPGVEVAAPESEYSVPPSAASEYSVPPSAASEMAPPAPQAAPPASATAPEAGARKSVPEAVPEAVPKERALRRDAARAPAAAAPATVATPAPRPEPRAFSTAPAPEIPAAPPAPAPAVRGAAEAQAPPPARSAMKQSALGEVRAKGELADSAGASAQANAALALPDPAAELERIARLRAQGRHDEADKALDEFLRKHPDYRIPDAVWGRVKRR